MRGFPEAGLEILEAGGLANVLIYALEGAVVENSVETDGCAGPLGGAEDDFIPLGWR